MVVCVCQIRFRRAVGGAVTRLWILAVPHGSCAGAGHLLGRVVKNLKNKVKLRGWPFKIPEDQLRGWQKRVALEVLGVFAFLAACHFLKAETRSLFNFFLSSFVCPMLRHWSCPNRTVTASRAYATNYNHPHRTASSFRTCLLHLHSCPALRKFPSADSQRRWMDAGCRTATRAPSGTDRRSGRRRGAIPRCTSS